MSISRTGVWSTAQAISYVAYVTRISPPDFQGASGPQMFNRLPGPDTEQLSWETDPGVKKWEKKKDLPMGKLTSILQL